MQVLKLNTLSKRLNRGGFLGLLAMLLLVGLACGDDATATPTQTSPPTLTSTPPATQTPIPSATQTAIPPTTPTPPYPVVVIDSNGNEVTFTQPPEKIVSYDSPVVEFLFEMGEGGRIVGAHDFVTYPPEAAEIPKVGNAFVISAETIVELEPDLVYTFYGSSVPDLENLGIKVLYLETPNTLDGIAEQMRMWGRILDNEDAAEQMAQEFESKVDEIVLSLASVTEGPRLFHDDTFFFTVGTGTLMGQVYTLLKAENIAFDVPDNLYGQLSPEVIVERDPEVIITTTPERPQEILDDPALQNVTAVKEGRVYAVDGDLVTVAGPRFVEAIEEVAKLLHPDLFE